MSRFRPDGEYEVQFSMLGDGSVVFATLHHEDDELGCASLGWSANDWPTLFRLMQGNTGGTDGE